MPGSDRNDLLTLAGFSVSRRAGRVLDGAYSLVREDGDTPEYRLQKSILVIAVALGVPITMLSTASAVAFDRPTEAVMALLAFLVLLIVVGAVFIVTKRWMRPLFTVTVSANMALSIYLTVVLGGVAASGANALWGIVPPVIALVLFGRASGLRWFALYLIVLTVAIFSETGMPNAQRSAFLTTLGGVSVFVFAMFLYFTRERDRAKAEAEVERARAESLLRDVLPDEIVTRLKGGETIIADRFDDSTVLFADIADFTPLSATMSADDLVALLDEVFRSFDRLAIHHGVEKIKTIGDCYMVAAGVPTPRHDHASVLAQMAIDMRALVASRDFGGHRLQFRIGLHSGPLVAGVIGEQKFLYDLWGDTVNTASRMESHGIAGEIQITAATRERIDGAFATTERGEVPIKGKGMMTVYLLESPAVDRDR